MNIGYFLGPAGCGKSHLTNSLYKFMNNSEFDVITVNLDPAVVRLPYSPAIDVREYVFYDEIVEKYQLGPNGAIIACMDQIALKIDDIIKEIDEFGSKFVLIDLPGQLEAFAYRLSGPVIFRQLSKYNKIGGYFLIDPVICNYTADFMSILLLGISTSYRLDTSLTYALSKSDLISEEKIQLISEWASNPDFLYEELRNQKKFSSGNFGLEMARLLIDSDVIVEFIDVSSETEKNIDLILGHFQRVWDDYTLD